MEIEAIIKELTEAEAVLNTVTGDTIRLPRRLVSSAEIGQKIYLHCASEPAKEARAVLNELLGNEAS